MTRRCATWTASAPDTGSSDRGKSDLTWLTCLRRCRGAAANARVPSSRPRRHRRVEPPRPGERQEVTPEILAVQRLGHQVSGCAARVPMPRSGCATSRPLPFRPGGRNPWRMRLRTVVMVSARSKKASMTSSRRSWQRCSRLKVLCRALVWHASAARLDRAVSPFWAQGHGPGGRAAARRTGPTTVPAAMMGWRAQALP
jgi:hypothetical protein